MSREVVLLRRPLMAIAPPWLSIHMRNSSAGLHTTSKTGAGTAIKRREHDVCARGIADSKACE